MTNSFDISLTTIPIDIFVFSIVPNLSIRDISILVSSSKSFYEYRENIYDTYVSNNKLLKSYSEKSQISIMSLIQESSFTEIQFFEIFDNTKIIHNNNLILRADPEIKKYIYLFDRLSDNVQNKSHILQVSIDSTFELFKILALNALNSYEQHNSDFLLEHHSEYIINVHYFLSNRLNMYFKHVYKMRNPDKRITDISEGIFVNFIHSPKNFEWYTSNYNPYYIYENINLLNYSKRYGDLMIKIDDFDESHIQINQTNNISTINFIVNICDLFYIVEFKLFGLYELFKYIYQMLCRYNFDKFLVFAKFPEAVEIKIQEVKTVLNDKYKTVIPGNLQERMYYTANALSKLIKSKK